MKIEHVIQSNTGIVVASDVCLSQNLDRTSFYNTIKGLEDLFGSKQLTVFHAGIKGDFKVRLEVSKEEAFVAPDNVASRCVGNLSLPTGSLVVHDGSFDNRENAMSIDVEPGDYVAAAYILDDTETPKPSQNKSVFDKIGPWLVPGSIVMFIAAAASSSWYDSALLFFLPLGVIILTWAVYLLAFNLTGGLERERKFIEEGSVDFVLQLRKIALSESTDIKDCELSV